jgi:hypothetical protein
VSDYNESRHVERIAQLFLTTLNGGFAAPLSRLSGHWS